MSKKAEALRVLIECTDETIREYESRIASTKKNDIRHELRHVLRSIRHERNIIERKLEKEERKNEG